MELEAGLFLAACAAAGFGITYLSGVALDLEERILFGVVLGAMVVAAASFVPALLLRDVTPLTVWIGLVVAIALGVAGVIAGRIRLPVEWRDAVRRRNTSWPLLLVLLVCGAWTVHLMHQAYVYTPAGLFSGYVNIWGDWAAHLSFAGSFAYGHNFPPEYPIDPGHRLGYPFMIDFFAADLVPLGLSLTEALTATSTMLGLALPGVIYLAALRFTAGRAASVIAVFVFLLSGGLGFVQLAGEIGSGGLGVLIHLPHEYTLNRDINLQWLTPVLAYIVPQRSTLFGFSLALIVLVLLWIALHENLGWRPFAFAGVVAGLLPVYHVHAYGTAVALAFFWALFNRRRQWIAYFLPAIVIGVPILVWMWPPQNTSICTGSASLDGYCIQPGWLAPTDWQRYIWLFPFDFVWFWLWNTSLLAALMLLGQLRPSWFATVFPRWFAPMWLWFVVPNIIVLQPWSWDNTKFFIFWALLGSMVVGVVLVAAWRRRGAFAVAAVAAMVLLCLSGFLDLYRASDFSASRVEFTDAGGLKVADWVRRNTSPYALFAVADDHNSPIPTLAGRRELIGYPGWLWTYGLADYVQKGEDDKRILDGDPAALDLVKQYRVDYVMIGPQEIPRGASRSYWDAHGTLVYDDGEYAVYRVGG
ncbi:MAG TPA: hypothetical protein VKE27_06440 [Candidatus Dormibacteraeota bacterium]|nr:hypothetical protein [Candidatus Dormibacteraeota bacterium]